jgi:hypothetical protein
VQGYDYKCLEDIIENNFMYVGEINVQKWGQKRYETQNR